MPPTAPVPGFLALHSNRTEHLFDAVAEVLERYRLAPLESEIILVQSSGIAEWLKMGLAQRAGICAATRIQLPAQFQWRLYRQVLGEGMVPERSALEKAPLAWRLMRLLANLAGPTPAPSCFEPLARYLGDGEPRRRFQLAQRIADLYDQYQVHRPDWLEAWAEGREVLRNAQGIESPIPAEQCWQVRLWQQVLATLDPHERALIRPHVHEQAIARLNELPTRDLFKRTASALPRRVVVFGLSHLAHPTLRLLSALARHSQVVLAIPNPCRFHWADIMDGREWLRSERRRHPLRGALDLQHTPLEQMHLHAHPLLAAWGRQARDFVRLLDRFDDADEARARFGLSRVDLFDDDTPADATLLEQTQSHIRDLLPLDEHPRPHIADNDRSIVFHIAHSPVRELEVLQDQLLELLAHPPGQAPLRPRDIVVMVPDINAFAPAIRAVFGQYDDQDPRHIPFDIADLSARGSNPLLSALQWVIRSPLERCHLSDLCGLFDVPAIAARFGLEPDAVPRLARWMQGAGIRWGLSATHREALGLEACGDLNTAIFGLRRMLMGYAVGTGTDAADGPFAGIEPFDEVGGLEAERVGALEGLIEALTRWLTVSRSPASPHGWAGRLRSLIDDLVKATDDADRGVLAALDDALERWLGDCQASAFDTELPLAVVEEAWMDALDAPSLGRRFRARGVTFCTLMPMRAIPFEVVCLLGMNDGDYPRRSPRTDFDLIAYPGQRRPGDRARRDDDRQLMLEALLSARRVFYVSWCGRTARDDSRPPPSVLVSQLRDYLSAGWSEAVVAKRTTEHPLQPFSRRYFERDSALRTYAREWRGVHGSDGSYARPGTGDDAHRSESAGSVGNQAPSVPDAMEPAIGLAQLVRCLRNPVKTFFRHRLGVVFDDGPQALPDDEPFSVDGLDRHQLLDRLARDLVAQMRVLEVTELTGFDGPAAIDRHLARLARSGALPLGGPGEASRAALASLIEPLVLGWRSERLQHGRELEAFPLRFDHAGILIEDWLDQRIESRLPPHHPMRLELDAGAMLDPQKKDPAVLPHRLLEAWVRALVAAVSGAPDHMVIVARDCTVRIRPMPAEAALTQLFTLISHYRRGLSEPLPIAVKTALAWITAGPAAALEAYEGSDYVRGEVDDAALARCFPDFEALSRDGRLETLAGEIYAPFLGWIDDAVTVTRHPPTALAGVDTDVAGDA